MRRVLGRRLAPIVIITASMAAVAACATPTTTAAATYPEKGKQVSMIIPFAPGGLTDLAGRLLAPELERELGIPVEVENKPGASSQIGVTALSQAKADGYTIGYTLLPTTPSSYLDPTRKATFNRDSFVPVANHFYVPIVAVVGKDSRFRNVAALVEEARNQPGKVKVGTGALGGPADMGRVLVEQSEDIQFANVQFDGGGPAMVALMGGHIDATFSSLAEVLQYVKSGQVRVIGLMDDQETDLLPGATTFASQGMDLTMSSTGVISLPAGAPAEVTKALSNAIKKSLGSPGVDERSTELGIINRYLDADEVAKLWQVSEDQVRQILADGASS